MTKFLLPALLAITLVACGGSPTAPTPTVTPPPPIVTPVTLSGRVTAVNGGQGLAGLQATLGAQTLQTGADGGFLVSALPTGPISLSLTGSSIVPRTLQVAMQASRTLAVDAIALDGQFDLTYYRALVRDNASQPLRRWTTNPNLYLQTGADARTLTMVEQVARTSIAEWSDGKLTVATVERGSGSRQGQAGWLTVLFSQEVGHCGQADVAFSGGTVTFYPNTPNCGCGSYQVRPTAVRHEFGHAMGFYHTDNAAEVMHPIANQCDTIITHRERYHAAIAYGRPVGNQDPDTDPTGVVNLTPVRVY